MTTDYTKVCWYCEEPAMVKIRDWYQCAKCGTTYLPRVELGPPVVEPGNVFDLQTDDKPMRRASHPTAGVARTAARAREGKHDG